MHPPNINYNFVGKIRRNIKKPALSTATRPCQIISTTLKYSTTELSAIILDVATLHSTIQRISKRPSFPYIFQTKAKEFVVTYEYKNNMKNEEHFLFSSDFTQFRPIINIFDRNIKEHSSTRRTYRFCYFMSALKLASIIF
ncbi:hypothetical protein RF11_04020 [Thelohanellus kitauei]|uniref:Uncharacterized protein n=1 Tax=Thelohanellus kitauei TaxID=669202 RepID=A0A0C2N5Q3_THEKT|nr:hypothetical protein RF11_04020 [Thelohanellus kitauei]